jgi:hypothetical protein
LRSRPGQVRGPHLTRRTPPQGASGELVASAVLRVEIDVDGGATPLAIERETERDASWSCCTYLLDTRWRPAKTGAGRPVARTISFTCNFELE